MTTSSDLSVRINALIARETLALARELLGLATHADVARVALIDLSRKLRRIKKQMQDGRRAKSARRHPKRRRTAK